MYSPDCFEDMPLYRYTYLLSLWNWACMRPSSEESKEQFWVFESLFNNILVLSDSLRKGFGVVLLNGCFSSVLIICRGFLLTGKTEDKKQFLHPRKLCPLCIPSKFSLQTGQFFI